MLQLADLSFSPPIAFTYNPLMYAQAPYEHYVHRFGAQPKQIVFLGMNPGPWGMAQTGVPFGDVVSVREWMGIEAPICTPAVLHPKRPVLGFACQRREVSGRRLWSLMADRFGTSEAFFATHFVLNYCPLAFFDASGRNITPDKLRVKDRTPLFAACDAHLKSAVTVLQPQWLVAIGRFTATRIARVIGGGAQGRPATVTIPHPSPANPQANQGWDRKVTDIMRSSGAWT